jgi:hypothetical protein
VTVAVYILIEKVAESAEQVRYRYHPDGALDEPGELLVNKATGEVAVVTLSPRDDDRRFFASRAQQKLVTHWRQGVYPQTTCWAS